MSLRLKVNFEFLTTSIFGLIRDIVWFDPPVLGEKVTTLTGVWERSLNVSVIWKYLSLILLTK